MGPIFIGVLTVIANQGAHAALAVAGPAGNLARGVRISSLGKLITPLHTVWMRDAPAWVARKRGSNYSKRWEIRKQLNCSAIADDCLDLSSVAIEQQIPGK